MQERTGWELRQEFIVNGILVTLNQKDRVYFECVENLQIFSKFWWEDKSRSIKECLDLMSKEKLNQISLG